MPAVKLIQEIYCATSGGGCGGWFTAPINPGLNDWVTFICPNCKHRHDRKYKDGLVVEEGRYRNRPPPREIEELLANPESFRMEPLTKESQERANTSQERVSVVVDHNVEILDEERCPYKADVWRDYLENHT